MTKTEGNKITSAEANTMPRVNPYVGPRPYLPGEELFGRDREKRDLLDQLLAERIILLHSPSGAGKSSLVNAGLIPLLRQEGLQDLPVVRVGKEPESEYSSQNGFNRFTYSMLLSLEEELTQGETGELEGPSEVESANQKARRKSRTDELAWTSMKSYLFQRRQNLGSNLNVLIFDQFEEIITTAPTDLHAKQDFFNQLGDVLSDRSMWALFVLRDDFLGAMEPFALSIPTQLSNTFRLDLLSSHAARQAIQKPVARQGITFLDSATHSLVNDLREVQSQSPSGEIITRLGLYVEPVQLQVVCLRLYDQLQLANRLEKTQIDDEDIKDVGDVSAALASYYAERVTITAGSIAVERQVRDWFEEQLITKSGLRGQVMKDVGTSGGLDNNLIHQFENAHLVRAEKRRGVTWFELAHDRLVDPVEKDNERWRREHLNPWQLRAIEWQKNREKDSLLLRGDGLDEFREWADKNPMELNEIDSRFLQSSLQWRETHLSPLQRKAAEWDSQGRHPNLLVSGVDLQEASDWALANTDEITGRELEYLEASREAAREAAERERRLKLEAAEQVAEAESRRAEEQASAAARFRRLAYIFGVVLVVALILAGLALLSYQAAQDQRAAANAASTLAIVQARAAETAQALAIVQARAAETSQALAEEQRARAKAAESTAVYNAEQAEQNEAEAFAQANTRRALGLSILASSWFDQKLDLSLLLSIEGYRVEKMTQTRQVLFQAWSHSSQIEQILSGHSDSVFTVAWSPDGRLASGSEDGTIILWDLENSKPERILMGHTDIVRSLAWSPDGRLASGSYDGTIILWDLVSGLPEITLEDHSDIVYSVAWSPDGRLASGSGDGTVIVWDLDNGSPEFTLEGHSSRVWSVAWSPDGRLASGSMDSTVILWNLATRRPRMTLEGHSDIVLSLAWSPDERLASGSADGTVIVWDAASGRQEVTLDGHSDAVYSVAWSPDGRLASGSSDHTVIMWDLDSGQPEMKMEGHVGEIYGIAWSPDGQLTSASSDNLVILWEIDGDSAKMNLEGHSRPVTSIAWSPDGQLASGSVDSTIILWDLESGVPGMTLEGYSEEVTSVAWSQDGRLASGSDDYTVIVWDLENEEPEMTLEGHSSEVDSVAWSPDGRLASGSKDGNIIVWDLENGVPELTLEGHSDWVNSVAWSPDGRLASGSYDGTIIVWDLENGEPEMTLEGHSSDVTSVVWSPDGRLTSGSQDNNIIIWNLDSGKPESKLEGHSYGVNSVTWSLDGQLASGSDDSTVIVWDLENYLPEMTLKGSTWINSVTWSPDGLRLASGSGDNMVQVWPIDPEVWIEQNCLRAGRNFTQAEWAQYFPDEPYRKTCQQWPLDTSSPTPIPTP